MRLKSSSTHLGRFTAIEISASRSALLGKSLGYDAKTMTNHITKIGQKPVTNHTAKRAMYYAKVKNMFHVFILGFHVQYPYHSENVCTPTLPNASEYCSTHVDTRRMHTLNWKPAPVSRQYYPCQNPCRAIVRAALASDGNVHVHRQAQLCIYPCALK
jgi:hypothetical protein